MYFAITNTLNIWIVSKSEMLSKENIKLPLLNLSSSSNQVTDLPGSCKQNAAEELPGVWGEEGTVYGSARGQDR